MDEVDPLRGKNMSIPLSHGYHEAIVLFMALAPSAISTFVLNKRFGNRRTSSNLQMLIAAGFVIGGALAEMLKMLFDTGENWSFINASVTIMAIWVITALLNYIYIVRAHKSR